MIRLKMYKDTFYSNIMINHHPRRIKAWSDKLHIYILTQFNPCFGDMAVIPNDTTINLENFDGVYPKQALLELLKP